MAATPKKPGKTRPKPRSKTQRKVATPKTSEPPFLDREMPDFGDIATLLSGGPFDAMLGLADSPQDVIDEFLQLGGRVGPHVDHVFASLVDTLSDLRIDANSGDRQARREAEELRAWLEQRLGGADVTGPQLMMIGQAFGEAGFDPGPSLQAAIVRLLHDGFGGEVGIDEKVEVLLDGLADESDDDPLVHFEALSHLVRYAPDENRWALAGTLAASPRPERREVALGFLLTGDERTAAAVCDGLVASGSDSTPARLLARLVLLRGLVSPERQVRIDAVIAALEPRVAPALPVEMPTVNAVFSAAPDGAGASTIVALLGKGRSSQMISMLIKAGQGLIEIGMMRGVSQQRLKELFAGSDIRAYKVSIEHAAQRIAAAVADNRASDSPLPLTILYAMEALDLSALPATRFSPESLFDEILGKASLDASTAASQSTAFNKLLGAGVLHTWFESSDAIDALLRKNRERDRRLKVLLEAYLPTRRGFWIEQCAWTAAVLREQKGQQGQLAIWAAVLGKQLCGNRPLAESPLMQEVAAETIKAFMLQ